MARDCLSASDSFGDCGPDLFATNLRHSPPFVEVGKIVAPDTVVCLVEVMATYNEVTAGVHGVIDEVAVANGDVVEFNQILFRLKRPPDPFGSW